MGTEGCVYSPVVAWLVLEDVRGCLAKFGVAISRFVLLTRRSVTRLQQCPCHGNANQRIEWDVKTACNQGKTIS